MSGRRKLELVTKIVSDADAAAAKPKKRAKKATALPPSTNVSSPVRGSSKKRKGRSLPLDEEDEESDVELSGPLHANGYEKDNFVVSDVEEDSEDDGFAPMRRPPPKRRQQTLHELGGPISRDSRFDEANINEVHADIILAFVEEAKQLEENLRNERGLRRVLFTEKQFREMAIGWTTTVDQMRQIPEVNLESIDRFGSKFVPLVEKYHSNYREMMGEAEDRRGGNTAAAGARRGGDAAAVSMQEIVDLISSDEDGLFDDDDDDLDLMGRGNDEEDEEEEDDDLESSKYFAPNTGSAAQDREAREWHERMAQLSQGAPSRSNPGGGTGGGNGKSGGNWRGGKRPFARRGGRSGGGSYRSASGGAGGVTKRKASGSRKSSAASTGRGARGGRSGGRAAGTSASRGASGIGMMPM